MKKLLISAALLLSALSLPVSADNKTAGPDAAVTKVYSVKADEVITSSTADLIKDAIKTAAADNLSMLMIELNTPGGILDATRTAVQHIMASPVPVTVYVGPSGARAASAGIFITIAADFAVMAEGTNIGAAHPVVAGGEDIKGDMRKKVENDTIAFIRSIAEKRGRDIKTAEKMVMESTSYTATEALKLKIIDAVVSEKIGIEDLLKKRFDIKGEIEIVPVEATFMQSVYKFLANPDILAALLFLGIVMIALEFKMPGAFIFAGLGGLCLVVFAIGANIIPINYLAFLLILGGFALLIAEIFVTSFGLLTVGGIVCLLFGLRMLFDRAGSAGISVSIWFMIAITAIVAAIALLIGRLVIKDFKRRPASGMETMLDKKAKILDWENGEGHVAIYGEIWNARGRGDFEEGEEVIIENYGDMVLTVRKKDK